MKVARPVDERFWGYVTKSSADECWLWTGSINDDGYGWLRVGKAKVGAHRLSVALDGRDPTGHVVRHSCDNPPCVNPHHLILGTHADNKRDSVTRGRHNRGERSGVAKLSSDKVVAVRDRMAAGESAQVIAQELGISTYHVHRLYGSGRWQHIEGHRAGVASGPQSCPECGMSVEPHFNGRLRPHGPKRDRCPGSGHVATRRAVAR